MRRSVDLKVQERANGIKCRSQSDQVTPGRKRSMVDTEGVGKLGPATEIPEMTRLSVVLRFPRLPVIGEASFLRAMVW